MHPVSPSRVSYFPGMTRLSLTSPPGELLPEPTAAGTLSLTPCPGFSKLGPQNDDTGDGEIGPATFSSWTHMCLQPLNKQIAFLFYCTETALPLFHQLLPIFIWPQKPVLDSITANICLGKSCCPALRGSTCLHGLGEGTVVRILFGVSATHRGSSRGLRAVHLSLA